MYPYDIDPREYVRQALAMQTPTAPSGAFLPQMTPASRGYYGPTHQALSDTLAAALAKQASNAGIFVPPPADNTGGLLSPATPAASFFRMPSDFSAPAYTAPTATSAATMPSTSVRNTVQSFSGGGRDAPEQPTYSPDFTRSNGPVGTQNGFTGPYSNGGGPGDSFVDGSLLGGIGNFFYALTHPASTPTSIDAIGSDRNTAAAPTRVPASAPMYRLSSNDLMPGSGPISHITGTPLAPPISAGMSFNPNMPTPPAQSAGMSFNPNMPTPPAQSAGMSFNPNMPALSAQNDLTGAYYPTTSIMGTDIGSPMPEPSQTLNGMLSANYPPVTGYDSGFSRFSPADFAASSGKSRDQLFSSETQQANSASARQQAEQVAAQQVSQLAQLQQLDAQQIADRSRGGYSGMEHSPDSGYGANNGGVSTGGESASERSGGAWRMGGPVPKHGNGPPQAVHGTVHEGEYVIRPESVKLLPPGLLSALNDIYKSPNPKKTLRGLLG